MKIGYIGLGNMGAALAARVLQGFALAVHDLDPAAVQRLVDLGAARCAGGARELAAGCDLVMLCLPTSNEVRDALFGPDGIAPVLRSGTLVVDQTTGDPAATRAMAAELARAGVGLVDAPVSGGAAGARAGTIAIMVGAQQEHFARVRPVLSAISPNVFHVGDVGAGHVMKLVNNMLSAGQRLMSMEALALAAKNGVAPARARDVLVAGGARNPFLEKALPQVLEGNLWAGFTLALMHKDVRLACQLGNDSGVPLLYGSLTRELYQMAIAQMGPQAQVNTPALMFDRLAGTHVVPAGTPAA